MARTAYSKNSYTGGAIPVTLFTGVASGVTTITITGTDTSWSALGVTGGFNLALSYGQTTEEKVYCPAGTYPWSSGSATISGITRGIDGTTAQLQLAGVTVVPVLTAVDLTEANLLVSQTLAGVATSSGQAMLSNGTNLVFGLATPVPLPVPLTANSGQVLTSNGSTYTFTTSANDIAVQTLMGALL